MPKIDRSPQRLVLALSGWTAVVLDKEAAAGSLATKAAVLGKEARCTAALVTLRRDS